MSDAPTILGVGEILWDVFPDRRIAGGAPFNFASRCRQLGHPSAVVSRVGADEPGSALLARVRALGLEGRLIQTDPARETGTVRVRVDADGRPDYEITAGVAWDFLEWDEDLGRSAAAARAVCFGSLAQRHPTARATIRRLLRAAGGALIVFDVNLRQQFYTREIVDESMRASHWLKLNDEELSLLSPGVGPSEALRLLREEYRLDLACLTRGPDGCLIQTAGEEIDVPGVPVRSANTVGAGDAFTAALVTAHLEGKPLREAAEGANRFAADVIS